MENNAVRARGSYTDIESLDNELIMEWNLLIANEEANDKLIRYRYSLVKYRSWC